MKDVVMMVLMLDEWGYCFECISFEGMLCYDFVDYGYIYFEYVEWLVVMVMVCDV